MKFRVLTLAASMFAIAACAENSPLPAAPEGIRMSADAESEGVVQSVSGNADIITGDGYRSLGIQARRSADGTVSGKFTLKQDWTGDQYDGEVHCFTIVANRAYVGTVVTSINGVPLAEYLVFRFVLVDNGEGSGIADQASQAQPAGVSVPAQPQAFCTNANLAPPMFDLVRGNLQVRP